MVEHQLTKYFEFPFGVQVPGTGAAVDADALPTYRVYEENNDVAVATGNCAKRDDAGTTGYYFARAQVTTGAGYEEEKDYYVEAIAIVGGVTSPPIPIGMFRVVPADVARPADIAAALVAINLDHLAFTICPGSDITNAVNDNTILAFLAAHNGDISDYNDGRDSQEAIGRDIDSVMADTTWINLILDGMKGAGWTDETLVTIQAALDAMAGGGTNACPLTFNDDDGNAVANLRITVQNVAEDALVARLNTNSVGVVTFNLDDGTYHILSPSTAMYEASNNTLVVSGATSATYTVTARTLPTPSSPEKYALFINGADEEAVLVGAAEWTVRVTEMLPVGLGEDDLVTLSKKKPFTSDATGQITWNVPKNTEYMEIEITYTMDDDSTEKHTESFHIDGTKAVDDAIDVADLI